MLESLFHDGGVVGGEGESDDRGIEDCEGCGRSEEPTLVAQYDTAKHIGHQIRFVTTMHRLARGRYLDTNAEDLPKAAVIRPIVAAASMEFSSSMMSGIGKPTPRCALIRST